MNETLSFAGWRPGNPDQIIPWKEKFDEEKAINFQISQACEISTHYSVETENVSDISVRIAC